MNPTDIEALRPESRHRVMDLLEITGLDVSDWGNFKGGIEKAASNPKYCYEWSYEEDAKQLIILSLWHRNLKLLDGNIIQDLNLRNTSRESDSPAQSRRAVKMDFSLQKATRLNMPLRVIICDGKPKTKQETKATAEQRLLDEELWYVDSYDSMTGDCRLVRGEPTTPYVDQFSLKKPDDNNLEKKKSTNYAYERSAQVRADVLQRAKGHCEWCNEQGFRTRSGAVYLESHHVTPLSEKGADSIDNVIALCPNHHRKAHFGEHHEEFKKSLQERVIELNK